MSGLRRIVFDTSTLVSAALRVGSVPHQAFRQAIAQGTVYVSTDTFAELEQVLLRPKFDRYMPHDVRRAFVDLVHGLAVQVPVSASDVASVAPACRDPKDNPFLALVLACAADVLVSSDADLMHKADTLPPPAARPTGPTWRPIRPGCCWQAPAAAA